MTLTLYLLCGAYIVFISCALVLQGSDSDFVACVGLWREPICWSRSKDAFRSGPLPPRKTFLKRLLKELQIWYAKFPSSKKLVRSLLTGHPPDSVERGLLDDPQDDEGPARGSGAGSTAVGAGRGGAGAAPPARGGGAQ